jgi:imidazolonepropionase-like amidohydrolase
MNKLPIYFIAAFVIFFSCSGDQGSEDSLIITNITVIDAAQGKREGQTIVVKDGIIREVGPSDKVTSSESGEIIDGTGKYIIPGLWDAHVHFTFIGGSGPAMMKLFTAYGISGVRDTGGKLDSVLYWRNYAEKMGNHAPMVKIAGPLLDGVPTVYNGSAPSRPPLGVGAMNPEEGIKLVDEMAAAKVDLLKAYEMLTPETFSAITERARHHGLKVTGHVPLSMNVIEAANAGLNSMEHMRNLEMSCTSFTDSLQLVRLKMLEKGSKMEGGVLRSNIHSAQRSYSFDHQDDEVRDEVLSVLASQDVWQIPTLGIVCGRLKRHFADPEWVAGYEVMPEPVRSQWVEASATFADNTEGGTPDAFGQWGLDMISHLKNKGIKIMAGTDTPIYYLTPGQSLHYELELLVEGGLTPLEAIESATLRPAEYFGMEGKHGTIEKGKVADLLILDADPIESISNTQAIHSFVRNGELLDRAALDKLIEEARGMRIRN